MGDNTDKKRKNKRAYAHYIIQTACFLAVLLVITVLTIFVAIKPVTELVNKVEANFDMQVGDIVLNENTYQPLSETSVNPDTLQYVFGDKIANISSSDFGLNCSVYFGGNRASLSAGVGFSGDTSLFGLGKVSRVVGYDETYFSSLRYADKGDVITVTTSYGVYDYRVKEVKYIDAAKDAYKDNGSDMLVLCSMCSDFSVHRGENLYVFADRIDKEVG
ncbi:MAG: sortase [Clostridium sp.]|nr:sortase [Clostridium sp.]